VEVGPGIRQGLWQRFEFQDGLPTYVIPAVRQDRQGDLWLAAHCYGLCRYDGAQATTFAAEDGLTDFAMSLLGDRHGRWWVGTVEGASCYDGRVFTSYTVADGLAAGVVWAILEDRQGRLWVGADGGLSRYDHQGFVTFTDRDGLPDNRVHALLEDREGRLWVGTHAGISRYDGERFVTVAPDAGRVGGLVHALLEDRQGRVWVGTHDGLSRLDGQDWVTFGAQEGLAPSPVLCLAEDREGALWLGSHGGGVSRYDGTRFARFTVEDGLANNQVYSLLEDQTGDLWAGTWNGINRYCRAQFAHFTTREGLSRHAVLSIAQDRQGHLWFGTFDGGVDRYDGEEFSHFQLPHSGNVNAIQVDPRGDLWFGCELALFRYDGQEFSRRTEEATQDEGCWALLADRQGRLWVGTRHNSPKPHLRRCDGQEQIGFTAADGLARGTVYALAEDRQGRIWVASHEGSLSVYDGQQFTVIEGLPYCPVLCVLVGRQGGVWAGLFGRGIWRCDPPAMPAATRQHVAGPAFTPLSAAGKPIHSVVTAVLEDSEGRVWFSTFGSGVYVYDGLVLQSLSRNDGLVHDAVQKLLQDHRGDIWITTDGGVTRYRPLRAPPVVRVSEVVADRRYGPVAELEMPVSRGLVAFEFQGRSWATSPGGMAYVYRLQGHADDWQTSYQRRVEYHDLPLGDYTFQVKAVDRDLNYSEPASVQVHVVPDPRLSGLSEALSSGTDPFVGRSPALRQVQSVLQQAAPTELTVLILGETGTGKGLAARLVHRLSPRKAGPFLQVNCGAIPQGLVESELFGHEKGAFTGAVTRKLGKVELAEAGTLFLDEIGDLSQEAQGKLLQLLEEKTFARVGGTRTRSVDARVVAATNRDLRAMVSAGTFRQDLYYRLQEFQVELPPLRQRREDIPELAGFFAARMAAHLHKRITHFEEDALAALQASEWPGNVRELEHLVKRAVVVCPGDAVRLDDLVLGEPRLPGIAPVGLTPEEYERQYLEGVLAACGWQIKGPQGAATRLGIPPATLRGRLRRLGLCRPASGP
jgi:DNA-binding NtrC family response regulator/ligand-binding sensor domain-containing protein